MGELLMNISLSSRRWLFKFLLFAGLMGIPAVPLWAQPYYVSSNVPPSLEFQNRYRWTNDNGQVFTPSNTTIRLHDFAGKIVFYCFFDVW